MYTQQLICFFSLDFVQLEMFLSCVCKRTLFTVNCGDQFTLAAGNNNFWVHGNMKSR